MNRDIEVIQEKIREESAFDAPVVSWAGAVGLMQLMPSTAREEAGLETSVRKLVDLQICGGAHDLPDVFAPVLLGAVPVHEQLFDQEHADDVVQGGAWREDLQDSALLEPGNVLIGNDPAAQELDVVRSLLAEAR